MFISLLGDKYGKDRSFKDLLEIRELFPYSESFLYKKYFWSIERNFLPEIMIEQRDYFPRLKVLVYLHRKSVENGNI